MRIKKIIAIFLTAALIFSALPVTGYAEQTEIFKVEVEAETTASTISASPIVYNQGDKITVKVRASQNTGITFLNLKIDYDEKILEPVTNGYAATMLFTEYDELTSVVTKSGDGYFLFFCDSASSDASKNFGITTATGIFAEITFTVKEICATNTAVTVSLFQSNPGNCVKDMYILGCEEVPFEMEADAFSVHKIDKETGVVTLPNCTDKGYTTYPCSGCKKDITGNIVVENGHDWADAVVENRVEPTCTKEGSYELAVYCKVCEDEKPDSRETKTIAMLEHDPAEAVEENRKEATCTAEGSYDLVVYCKDCDAELSKEAKTIPTIPHKLVHHDAQQATHTQIGWDEYDTCEDCDYTTYVQIPMVPYIAGDVTGDDEVTDADAVYLLYATFYPEKYPLNQDADYNGDGEVTDADAIYLLYATFYPEKYPLTKTEVKE